VEQTYADMHSYMCVCVEQTYAHAGQTYADMHSRRRCVNTDTHWHGAYVCTHTRLHSAFAAFAAVCACAVFPGGEGNPASPKIVAFVSDNKDINMALVSYRSQPKP
jgi:hypothetical protein